jgi:hypothetical protein
MLKYGQEFSGERLRASQCESLQLCMEALRFSQFAKMIPNVVKNEKMRLEVPCQFRIYNVV